jgi:hypothetical protein
MSAMLVSFAAEKGVERKHDTQQERMLAIPQATCDPEDRHDRQRSRRA